MNKFISQFLCLCGFIAFTSACGSATNFAAPQIDTPNGDPQNADSSSIDDMEPAVGINVGNPIPPKTLTNAVNFIIDDSSADELLACHVIHGNSQICNIPTINYQMGILALFLDECVDAQSEAMICNPTKIVGIKKRIQLYSGDLIELSASNENTVFPQSWQLQAGESINAGGLQAVVAHIGAVFPDDESDPEAAAMVMPALRGVPFRICTSPSEQVPAIRIAELCGNPQAHGGDILFDTNRDGIYGFMNLETITEDFVEETTVRKGGDGFSNTATLFSPDLFHSSAMQWLFTNPSFFSVDGFYAPLLHFRNVTPFDEATSERTLKVTLNADHTIMFRDGAKNERNNPRVCVQSLSPSPCPGGIDSDPNSVGVYNPYYDGFMKSRPPSAEVTVE